MAAAWASLDDGGGRPWFDFEGWQRPLRPCTLGRNPSPVSALSTAAASLWRSPLQGWPLGSGSLAPHATSAHVGSFGFLRGGVGGSQLGCHRPWQVRWIELRPSASVPVPSIPGSRAFGMRPLAPEALAPSARPLASGPWGLAVKVRPPARALKALGLGAQPTTSAASGPRCPAHGTDPQCLVWGSRHASVPVPAIPGEQSRWHGALGLRALAHNARPLASGPQGWPSKCNPRPGPSRRWVLTPSPRRPRHLARGVQRMAPTLSALPGAPATHAWRHPWTRVVGAPSAAAPRLPDLGAQAWGQH